MENLSKGLSRELASKKIRVLNVAPGVIDTRNLLKEKKSNLNKMLSSIPNKRLGNSEEVANLVNYLIDDKSEYINGTILHLGWKIKKILILGASGFIGKNLSNFFF